MKGIVRKLKQRFCKHEMQKLGTYEIITSKDGRIVNAGFHEDYVCSKCGKEETIVVPQFIPNFKSIYNKSIFNDFK